MEISNKQKPRDCDKEPLIINGYEKIFCDRLVFGIVIFRLNDSYNRGFYGMRIFMFAKRRSYEFGNVRDSYCDMYL